MIHLLLTGVVVNCLCLVFVLFIMHRARTSGNPEIEHLPDDPNVKLGLPITTLIPFALYATCMVALIGRDEFERNTIAMTLIMAVISSIGIWFYTL